MAGNPVLNAERRIVQKKAFLDALEEKYSVGHACRASGVGRSTVYEWRDEDAAFAQAWENAKENALDALEESLFERAKAKDTIAGIFLLKGGRPDKYRERVSAELSGPGGTPLAIQSRDDVQRQLAELGPLPVMPPQERAEKH